MKLPIVSVAFLALVSALAAADNADDLTKKLDGNWKVLEAVKQGAPLAEKEAKSLKVMIKDGTFTIKENKHEDVAKFKVDPSKTPATIDFVENDKPIGQGIYEFDGDKLKICWALKEGTRPKEFASKEGAQTMLLVLTREK